MAPLAFEKVVNVFALRTGIRLGVGMVLIGVTALSWPVGDMVRSSRTAEAEGIEPAACLGDELITFAPADPRVDEEMLVAVTSAQRHRGVWLAGTEKASFLEEYEGQRGWVWTWSTTPTFPGPHRYRFFIDSTLQCAEGWVEVGTSMRPTSTPHPATPTPRSWRYTAGNWNDNRSSNDNDDNDNNGRRSRPTPTPTATPTATVVSYPRPAITSLSPSPICPGSVLTIRGRGFGDSRLDVDGQVLVDGTPVRAYLSWSSNEIVVLVSPTVSPNAQSSVYLVTLGGYTSATIEVVYAPC